MHVFWHRYGQDPFQDNIVAETEMSGGGSIMVWACFRHDHKLDFVYFIRDLRCFQQSVSHIGTMSGSGRELNAYF